MLYHLYELNHAAVTPLRTVANFGRFFWKNPVNPLSESAFGRSMAASLDMFERLTRRYGKPEFGIEHIEIDGKNIPVREQVIWQKPFCALLHFQRQFASPPLPRQRKKILIVAPMSGHYATLLRGTVEDMLAHGDVYITDWADARDVPLSKGGFDLDDYIDYIIEILEVLGPDTHIMAVCQPSVPVLAAVSFMHQAGHRCLPASMVLMGGPIDTRRNPTVVNNLAVERGIDWFRHHALAKVPFPNAGFMRSVYPGFMQLTGFMTMNLDRHISAHNDLFWHLVEGDDDPAEKHREFYDEYMSVMDLTAEFYLQTVERVFIHHDLANNRFYYRDIKIDPAAITSTALMTVEGERDDISGVGQTEAAHDLCTGIAKNRRLHHLQPKVGHYGVFNGNRFRRDIAPKINAFMDANITVKTNSAKRGKKRAGESLPAHV